MRNGIATRSYCANNQSVALIPRAMAFHSSDEDSSSSDDSALTQPSSSVVRKIDSLWLLLRSWCLPLRDRIAALLPNSPERRARLWKKTKFYLTFLSIPILLLAIYFRQATHVTVCFGCQGQIFHPDRYYEGTFGFCHLDCLSQVESFPPDYKLSSNLERFAMDRSFYEHLQLTPLIDSEGKGALLYQSIAKVDLSLKIWRFTYASTRYLIRACVKAGDYALIALLASTIADSKFVVDAYQEATTKESLAAFLSGASEAVRYRIFLSGSLLPEHQKLLSENGALGVEMQCLKVLFTEFSPHLPNLVENIFNTGNYPFALSACEMRFAEDANKFAKIEGWFHAFPEGRICAEVLAMTNFAYSSASGLLNCVWTAERFKEWFWLLAEGCTREKFLNFLGQTRFIGEQPLWGVFKEWLEGHAKGKRVAVEAVAEFLGFAQLPKETICVRLQVPLLFSYRLPESVASLADWSEILGELGRLHDGCSYCRK